MGYKHLGIDERIYIENQLKFKVKISEICTTKIIIRLIAWTNLWQN
ncbi:hypothetical protein [Spiroplasma endosymbiont of Nephrotoma flavescens]